MPKGNKTYQYGGERRTFECPCGWIGKGSIREANDKYRRHIKYCAEVVDKARVASAIPTSIDPLARKRNGWDGLQGNNVVKDMIYNLNSEEYGATRVVAPKKLQQESHSIQQGVLQSAYLNANGAIGKVSAEDVEDAKMQEFIQMMTASGADVKVINGDNFEDIDSFIKSLNL